MRPTKICIIIFLLISVGCTHARYLTLTPNYSSIFNEKDLKNNEVSLKNIKTTLIFCQGKYFSSFKDNEILTHQKIGVHTYNYLPGRPVKDVMFNGLENLFIQSGHQWSTTPTNADIRVDVNFKSLHCADYKDGLIGYDAITNVIAKVDFYSVRKDSLIYSKVYGGVNTNIPYSGEDRMWDMIILESRRKGAQTATTKMEDLIKRYGYTEDKTFHTEKIVFSASLNSTLLYESVDFSFINLMSNIGKDNDLKMALNNFQKSKKN